MAGCRVVCVRCTRTLHAPRWCILPRIKVGKTACTSFQVSTHHVLRSPPTTAVEERPGERRKTPYFESLDINLITTRLSIAANRRVGNRLCYSASRIGLTTSRCASPRHGRDLSSIFSKILSTSINTITTSLQSVARIFLNYLYGKERKS